MCYLSVFRLGLEVYYIGHVDRWRHQRVGIPAMFNGILCPGGISPSYICVRGCWLCCEVFGRGVLYTLSTQKLCLKSVVISITIKLFVHGNVLPVTCTVDALSLRNNYERLEE